MLTAIPLIVLGTLLRFGPLLHHKWNFVPIMAMALYAGARLPRKWAVTVPLVAMMASDLAFDWGTGRSVFALDRLAGYACCVLVALSGRWLKDSRSPMARMGMALGASTLFFLISNLAVWASPEFVMYPRTWAGLMECYVKAIPFYGNTLMADLIGTAVLFGLDALAHAVTGRLKRPVLAAE